MSRRPEIKPPPPRVDMERRGLFPERPQFEGGISELRERAGALLGREVGKEESVASVVDELNELRGLAEVVIEAERILGVKR